MARRAIAVVKGAAVGGLGRPCVRSKPVGSRGGCGGPSRGPGVVDGCCELGVVVVWVAGPWDGGDVDKSGPETLCELGVEQQLGAKARVGQFLVGWEGRGSGETDGRRDGDVVPAVGGEVGVMLVGEVGAEALAVDVEEDVVDLARVVNGTRPSVGLSRGSLGDIVSSRELEVGGEVGEEAGGVGVGMAWVVGVVLLGVGVEEYDRVRRGIVAAYGGGVRWWRMVAAKERHHASVVSGEADVCGARSTETKEVRVV